jgi:hypothetical protein
MVPSGRAGMTMIVSEPDFEIREDVYESPAPTTERVQEGAVEIAAGASTVIAAGSLLYQRASYHLQRDEVARRAEDAAAMRWELHEEMRRLRYELGGLEALDAYDEYYEGFGMDEDW